MVWWVLALVVVLIVGPFATLRAVQSFRSRRPDGKRPPPVPEEPQDPDKPTGFW